jgi:hypothetical protein
VGREGGGICTADLDIASLGESVSMTVTKVTEVEGLKSGSGEVFVKIKTKEEAGQDPEYLLFGIDSICG